MGMLDDITWTCHVCGKIRTDDKISVHSKTISGGGVEIRQNVRYCNDDPDCERKAKDINWIARSP